MIPLAWLVGFAVLVMVGYLWGHTQEPVSDQYTLTIHYPDGRARTLTGVESHRLFSEDGATFLSVILADGRRFLISVEGREFEFSSELSEILTNEQAQKNQGARQ